MGFFDHLKKELQFKFINHAHIKPAKIKEAFRVTDDVSIAASSAKML
jgi:hypothetical protein